MSNQVVLTVLSSLVSAAGIVYLLFWRVRLLSMDSFRQRLFGLRDELFDYAAVGNIEFAHPAYAMLRSTMNGYIRFAHKTTVWHGLIFALTLSRQDREFVKARSFEKVWAKATAGLRPEVKHQLECFRKRLDKTAFFYFFASSPELLLLFLPLIIFGVLVILIAKFGILVPRDRIMRVLRKRFDEADNMALLYGEAPA